MTISAYGTGAYRAARTSEFVSTRTQLDDLQRQLTTQKKSETYGGLGADRRVSLDLNAKISALDSWISGIDLSSTNLKLSTQAVQNFQTLTNETKKDITSNSYLASSTGRSAPQILAEEKLKQTLDQLNTSVNGHYLFSGRTTDVEPTASFSLIMNGDGAGKAGLKDLIAERKAADLGTTGLGRLTAGGTGTTATIAEEATTHPYGFKIAGASTDSAALVPSYTAGPPAGLSVDVASQPLAGETLRIKLNLPDGTQEEIALTARANGVDGDPNTGFTIGADANETAANLRASIAASLGNEAKTTLSAASATIAAENFFAGSASSPPLRVPGPPYETATAAPAAGTAANTVIWYQGDDASDSARSTATVQIDKGQTVNVGARANEQVFQIGLAAFAVLAAENFPATDSTSKDRYEALTERVRSSLGYADGVQTPTEIITELGSAQSAMASAKERHSDTKNYLTTAVGSVENVTTEDVAVQILALQNRLQASYQTTAILSQLSLTKYL